MAYVDYIHCADCDCKLIPDGYQNAADYIESKWGDLQASDYTVKLYCPDCQAKKDQRIAELEAELARYREALTPTAETKKAYWGSDEIGAISWCEIKTLLYLIREQAGFNNE